MGIRQKLLTVLAFSSLSLAAVAVHAQTAQEIMAGSDKVRNPGRPFRVTNTLTEYVSGTARNQSVLTIFAKEDKESGQFRDLIRYVDPPRDLGKLVLMDGRLMWFFDPSSKASIRISPQQRLLGQASINDVLTVNLAADYSGTIVATEKIQDANRQEHLCWHLDVKASNDRATYNRIEYWVEQGTYYPIKAKFYGDTGRLMKILYYRQFEERLGGVRPSEAIIIDAVDSSLVTTINFGDYRFQEIPEAWFQREFLPRLKAD